ncbi:hypothetical protein Afil01_69370 [Actinorhabdospora filicis]|uniref:Uncharacterized protein n=1 Tax=Actinorhabdospora filicis TaxID=1785913 RepID=A0A9W6WES0_9ACTN|nr:hypothetical protein [Actinorhabdospora filicis]GLZ82130.1 hypothetical protein Afil01_69370 [Actinorhabdospora filicis]
MRGAHEAVGTVLTGIATLVFVAIGLAMIGWASGRNTRQGRIDGKLLRWKFNRKIIALVVLFLLGAYLYKTAPV